MDRWECAYCSTANPVKEKTCLACGAPFIEPENPGQKVNQASDNRKESLRLDMEPEQLATMVRSVNEPVSKGLQAYSIFWRTLGEALAIAVTCFALGVLATAAGLTVFGILVSVVVGYLVGRNYRNFYAVSGGMITAVITGFLIGLPCLLIGLGPKGLFIMASAITILAALGISYQSTPSTKANPWDKLRPFIGILGGVAFSLLGSALTWSIITLGSALIRWISQMLGN